MTLNLNNKFSTAIYHNVHNVHCSLYDHDNYNYDSMLKKGLHAQCIVQVLSAFLTLFVYNS